MNQTQLKVGDAFGFHTEPPTALGKIVPYGIQDLTDYELNHIATYLGDGMVIGALDQGYTEQTLKESITQYDTVTVYRYHADRDEMTVEQQKKLVAWCLDHKGVPYDYPDILALAVLMEINDTTWESYILRKGFEWMLNLVNDVILDFIEKQKAFCEMLMGQAIQTDKGLLMCSMADYLARTQGAGVPMRILNKDGRDNFYKPTGNVLDRYREVNKQYLLTPDVPSFVTPRDIAECWDMDYIGKLSLI